MTADQLNKSHLIPLISTTY